MENKFLIIASGNNCAAFAKGCIESVKAQTYRNFDAVFIDDGSTDGTWDVIQKEAPNVYPKEAQLYSFKNPYSPIGTAAIRNLIKLDGTEIIVWLDLDDELFPHALKELNDVYTSYPDTWLTYGNYRTFSGAQPIKKVAVKKEILDTPRANDFYFYHLRSYRSKLYMHLKPDDIFLNTPLVAYPDLNLLTCLVELAGSKHIRAIEFPLYKYRDDNPNAALRKYSLEIRNEEKERVKQLTPRQSLQIL